MSTELFAFTCDGKPVYERPAQKLPWEAPCLKDEAYHCLGIQSMKDDL